MSSEEREDGAALGMHTFQIVNDWRPRLHRNASYRYIQSLPNAS